MSLRSNKHPYPNPPPQAEEGNQSSLRLNELFPSSACRGGQGGAQLITLTNESSTNRHLTYER